MSEPRPISPARVIDLARAVGFDDAGIAPVDLPHEEARLRRWLDAGYAGDMAWLERDAEVRLDLRRRFPWARSVVVVLRSYRPEASDRADGIARFVASYARGRDYHDVLPPRLLDLAQRLSTEVGSLRSHAYVDTGPALERSLAVAAGLGWQANNTLLLNGRHGSRFCLGLLVTDLELSPTGSRSASCGTCRACQPACPTGAFVTPGVLDARRCISYLTIEHRGPIDRALRPAMGQWLFGCDLCQTCCPFEFHADAPGDVELRADGGLDAISLGDVLSINEQEFRAWIRRSPLWRAKREGLVRNALIVVGNGEHLDCRPDVRALLQDASPVVREAASWCLGRIGRGSDEAVLRAALELDAVGWVREGMETDIREVLHRA